jgi:hypothetical protein
MSAFINMHMYVRKDVYCAHTNKHNHLCTRKHTNMSRWWEPTEFVFAHRRILISWSPVCIYVCMCALPGCVCVYIYILYACVYVSCRKVCVHVCMLTCVCMYVHVYCRRHVYVCVNTHLRKIYIDENIHV